MSEKTNGVKYSKSVQHRIRRGNALDRLQKQLDAGTKNTKEGVKELSDKDKNRITKEIKTLKERV